MPELISRASGARAINEMAPPVSGSSSSEAMAVAGALAEAVALASAKRQVSPTQLFRVRKREARPEGGADES